MNFKPWFKVSDSLLMMSSEEKKAAVLWFKCPRIIILFFIKWPNVKMHTNNPIYKYL